MIFNIRLHIISLIEKVPLFERKQCTEISATFIHKRYISDCLQALIIMIIHILKFANIYIPNSMWQCQRILVKNFIKNKEFGGTVLSDLGQNNLKVSLESRMNHFKAGFKYLKFEYSLMGTK